MLHIKGHRKPVQCIKFKLIVFEDSAQHISAIVDMGGTKSRSVLYFHVPHGK